MADETRKARAADPGEQPGPDGPGTRALYFWVAITVAVPAVDIAQGRSHPVWLAALGLGVLIVLFAATIRATFGERGSRWPAVALLVASEAVTLAYVAFFEGSSYTLFIMPSMACGAVLVARRTGDRTSMAALGVLVAAAVLLVWPPSAGLGASASVASIAFMPGLVVWIILRLFAAIHELRAAREELARLAVADERLRFARDLHDLLGHTLSVMVVKSEAPTPPPRRPPTSRRWAGGHSPRYGRRSPATATAVSRRSWTAPARRWPRQGST